MKSNPFICLFLLLSVLSSCGRKEPLRIVVYESPLAPVNLKAVHRDSSIILSWAYPSNDKYIKGFVIQKSDGREFRGIGTVEKQYFFIDKNIAIGGAYKYRVIAKSNKDVLGLESEFIGINPIEPPQRPKNLSFIIGTDMVKLSWDKVEGDVYYNIYKKDEAKDYPLTPINTSPVRDTWYETPVAVNHIFHYTVRALYNTLSLDEGLQAVEVSVASDDYIPSVVQGLQAVRTSAGIQLFWKDNPEPWVRQYSIYRKLDRGGFIRIAKSATTAFLDDDGSHGAKSYVVNAIGPTKEGPQPNEALIAPD